VSKEDSSVNQASNRNTALNYMNPTMQNRPDTATAPIVVIGAGPAGLAAAYDLSKRRQAAVCLEADTLVGGISRTVEYRGFRFDVGGHRFFTKYQTVRDLWHELLGDELLVRSRLSRIYYRNRFFYYPIRPLDALAGLGPVEAVRIALSYLNAQLRPRRPEASLEDWVANRFGYRLYRHFFKSYTEKVWGIPCTEIRAEWAAQRIKGLSLMSALRNALFKSRGLHVKSLIEQFEYPRLGPGQMYERMVDRVREMGNQVLLQHRVARVMHKDGRITQVVAHTPQGEKDFAASHVISSMPITDLVKSLSPPPPSAVLAAADSLTYRGILTVNLLLNREEHLPDTWIYIHDPAVQVGRVQLFKNWSPWLVPDETQSSRGLEYFCTEGDELWTSDDAALVEKGKQEIDHLRLCQPEDVFDAFVIRVPKCYPVYDAHYRQHLDVIRAHLARFDNLHLVGRTGLFKYNNSDHSILTALLAVENLYGAKHDVWAIDADDEYLEEDSRHAQV
jgi:protoporphyrinogen oxidase